MKTFRQLKRMQMKKKLQTIKRGLERGTILMSWYAVETYVMLKQAEIERNANEYWKFDSLSKSKRVKPLKEESEVLYGKAVHVLQEMLDSDNAALRLQAAEIVMKHSIKRRSKMTFIS